MKKLLFGLLTGTFLGSALSFLGMFRLLETYDDIAMKNSSKSNYSYYDNPYTNKYSTRY